MQHRRPEARPRPGRESVRALAALVAAVFAAACSPDARPAPDGERVTVRVDRERAFERADRPAVPPWDAQRVAVVQESRDAVRAAWGESVAFPVTAVGELRVLGAFAVETKLAGEAKSRVACELRLLAGDRDEVVAQAESTLEDAAQTWRSLVGTVRVAAGEEATLVATARWLDPTPPSAETRPLLAVPRALAPQPSRRNVLLITIDTLRADHLGYHGYARATSPRIDDLVARGAHFERAISTSPWTLPSYGTLFTGLEPARHRAGISARRENAFGSDHDHPSGDFQALVGGVPTLAGIFAANGYATGALVSNPFLFAGTRIDRGFDSFAGYVNRAEAGVAFAREWIEARGDAPWFLMLHLMDPHTPYTPPAPYDTRFAAASYRDVPGYPPTIDDVRAGGLAPEAKARLVDQYDGEIAYTDAQVGVLLDFLKARGTLDRTLIVLHSDHGEEFFEHGSFEHGHSLHDEVLHVPLAFVAPGLVAPKLRVPGRTSTVDAFPTLLDLAGLPIPPGIDGTSRAQPLRADRPLEGGLPRSPVISESMLYGDREMKSWSDSTEKIITDGSDRSQYFELEADPGEKSDLAAQRAERVRELRDDLRRRARALRAAAPADDAAGFGRDARGDLERLGYPGADPK